MSIASLPSARAAACSAPRRSSSKTQPGSAVSSIHSVSTPSARAAACTPSRTRSSAAWPGARTSRLSRASPGTWFVEPGSALMRPTVATAPGSASASSCAASTARAAGTSASRRPAIAAVPAWSETPRTVQRQRSRAASDVATAERSGHVDEVPSLLDVHLDPGGHAGQERRRGTRALGRHASQRGQVAQDVALRIRAREHLVDVHLAAQRARAEDRRAEARALLVDHRAHRERPPRAAGAPRGLDRDQPGHDAERAVERAAVGDRVDVRSDRVERALLPARLDRPEVAGRVLRDLQSESGGGRAEPVARGVLPRPPGHAVPAAGLAPDGRQLGEEAAVEAGVDHATTGSSVAPGQLHRAVRPDQVAVLDADRAEPGERELGLDRDDVADLQRLVRSPCARYGGSFSSRPMQCPTNFTRPSPAPMKRSACPASLATSSARSKSALPGVPGRSSATHSRRMRRQVS